MPAGSCHRPILQNSRYTKNANHLGSSSHLPSATCQLRVKFLEISANFPNFRPLHALIAVMLTTAGNRTQLPLAAKQKAPHSRAFCSSGGSQGWNCPPCNFSELLRTRATSRKLRAPLGGSAARSQPPPDAQVLGQL